MVCGTSPVPSPVGPSHPSVVHTTAANGTARFCIASTHRECSSCTINDANSVGSSSYATAYMSGGVYASAQTRSRPICGTDLYRSRIPAIRRAARLKADPDTPMFAYQDCKDAIIWRADLKEQLCPCMKSRRRPVRSRCDGSTARLGTMCHLRSSPSELTFITCGTRCTWCRLACAPITPYTGRVSRTRSV